MYTCLCVCVMTCRSECCLCALCQEEAEDQLLSSCSERPTSGVMERDVGSRPISSGDK